METVHQYFLDGKILSESDVLNLATSDPSKLQGIQKVEIPKGYSLVKNDDIIKTEKNIFRFSSLRGKSKRKIPQYVKDHIIDVLSRQWNSRKCVRYLKRRGIEISHEHLNNIFRNNELLLNK